MHFAERDKMKIAITFPVYIKNEDHLYFTKQTLETIKTLHDYKVFLIVNYLEPSLEKKFDELVDSDQRIYARYNTENNVSKAWNMGIECALKEEIPTIIIPNNDIIWHEKCIDNLVKFINDHPEFLLWTANPYHSMRGLNSVEFNDSFDIHPGFSCFAVTSQSLGKLKEIEEKTYEPFPGRFDENFHGAYFEDQDFHQRILRVGCDAAKTASAVYYHFGSRTIKVDEELNNNNHVTYENNRNYFAQKWGYDAHGRGFTNEERVELGFPNAFNKGEKQR